MCDIYIEYGQTCLNQRDIDHFTNTNSEGKSVFLCENPATDFNSLKEFQKIEHAQDDADRFSLPAASSIDNLIGDFECAIYGIEGTTYGTANNNSLKHRHNVHYLRNERREWIVEFKSIMKDNRIIKYFSISFLKKYTKYYTNHFNMLVLKNKFRDLVVLEWKNLNESSNYAFDFDKIRFPSLRKLYISHSRVYHVEKVLPQLTHVTLINNFIQEFPRNFNSNLVELEIRNIQHTQIVQDFSAYKNLSRLCLANNKLEKCPFLPMHGSLTYLDLSVNSLYHIQGLPNTIRQLFINNNNIDYIESFPLDVGYINMNDNPVRRMPLNLLMCSELYAVYCYQTEIELNLMEVRFLERLNHCATFFLRRQDSAQINVYSDDQSVHNSSIQKTFLSSCQNLFLDRTPDQKFTGTGNMIADKIIEKNNRIQDEHSILRVTYRQIFQKVWNRISSQPCDETRRELIKRLTEETIDGDNKCFMGRITRLVNTLSGFYPDIHIEIGESEQIYAKIMAHRRIMNGSVHKDILRSDLLEIGVSREKISEWLDEI